MATFQWKAYGTAVTALTTELDALADDGWALSAVLDNGTSRYLYADALLKLSAAVTAGSNSPLVEIYLLRIPDGVTDIDPPGSTAGAIPQGYRVGVIPAVASASFSVGALDFLLSPGKYRVGAKNSLGVALPATGNTLTLYPYGEESV